MVQSSPDQRKVGRILRDEGYILEKIPIKVMKNVLKILKKREL